MTSNLALGPIAVLAAEDDGFLARGTTKDFRDTVVNVALAWGDDAGERWERERNIPPLVFQTLGQAGVFRRRWGNGRQAGTLEAAATADVLSYVAGGVALAVCLHSEVFVGILHSLATSTDQRAVYERSLEGDVIGCFASTEKVAGSDLRSLACSAQRKGSGWHLFGEKRFTSNAITATHAVVLAHIVGADDRDPPAAFLVPLQNPGVQVTGIFDTLGFRSCPTSQLSFDIDLAPSALLGNPRSSLLHVKRALQSERLSSAVQTVTAARIASRFASAYARVRVLEGVPLIRHSSTRQRLGAIDTQVMAAEAFLEQVANEALRGRDVTRQTAALKVFTANVAAFAIDEAIQILGGRGYLQHFPLERMLRDVRLARIGGGTDEVMREIVAGRANRADEPFDLWVQSLEHAEWYQ